MSDRPFSHIYVEESLRDNDRADAILKRFRHATVIPIADYRQLFMRPRQEWRGQKESQKLVLAERKAEFLYAGSAVTPHFGFQHFFYNTLALNCLYDCSYCYLQGMLPSANLVLFLNVEDFIEAALAQLRRTAPMYLCLSYDTDLLPLESFVPYTDLWLQVVRDTPELTVELRTKSAATHALRGKTPCDRYILAWTLAPQIAIDRFERRTPSLKSRLLALRSAIDSGWSVRVCLDPVLEFEGWQAAYEALLADLSSLPLHLVRDVSVGTLRMSKEHWKQFSRVRSDYRDLGPTQPQGQYVAAPGEHLEVVLELARQFLPRVEPAWTPAAPLYMS
ncbi:MAG: DNA photolyase [Bdellovibrionota bacterium]|nr:MAG: DNA photolyase [Bdellovibrionota bacterium]